MSSKSELTKTIENQQAQIQRLEQRFTDVVSAYKNLKKEKEALESTFRVLTSSKETVVTNEEKSTTEGEEPSDHETENSSASQEKIQTLQQNITTITEQKNRMEQMFQSDKRKLKSENDELKKSLEEAKAENIILKEKSDQEIKELKKVIRESQRDYERRTADHNVTLREVQTLLSTERNKIESMEHQFDECRAKVVTLESQIETLKKQNILLNQQYQTKLNETREKDLTDLEEFKRAKQIIEELNSKLKSSEIDHREQMQLESKRNQQLERKISELTNENAQRVSNTESRIAELSEQIGVIEKQRAQDQMTIQRLKERIAQLDVENSLLTKASATSIEQDKFVSIEDGNSQDFDSLMKHIGQLKVLIRLVNDRFGKSLTLEEILNIERETSINGTTSLHSKCQEEIERLKGELEKYRHKTVAAFKAKASKDGNTSKEIDDLRCQIDHLREKLIQSQSLYNSENERHNQVVEKLQICLNTIRDQHRHEIEQVMTKKRAEINELECELEKQRERTVRLLSEKDRELEAIRSITNDKSIEEPPPATTKTTYQEFLPDVSSSTIGGPSIPMNSDNSNILYFIQEQQLREQETINLRKQRHDLEMTIRDLQRKYSYEISQLQMNIEQLQDDLERIRLSEQRNESLTKNEHNIDYIKNVFYHYLLATDTQVKQTMANALMTILHFSSKEKAKIESLKTTNLSLASTGWFSKS